jgi:hypothetical protein
MTRPPEGIEDTQGLMLPSPAEEEASRSEEIAGMMGGFLTVRIDDIHQMGNQGRHGDDVEAVVLKDVGHETAVAAPEPVEVSLGDLKSRDIALPQKSQDRLLQGTQTPIGEAVTEEPPRGV